MRNNTKVIRLVPVFLGLLIVFWGSTLVATAHQFPQLNGDPLTNSMDGNLNTYLPLIKNNYGIHPIDSPFSIEIAALHLINPTNSLNQDINEEQFYASNDQAFPTLLAALNDSGAAWTRIVINWSEIEKTAPVQGQPPVYDLGALQWYDNRLRQISEIGVNIIAAINTPPAWASNSQICPAITLDHADEYKQFLTDIVTRYSQPPFNIRTWEIFNEADANIKEVYGGNCFGTYGTIYSKILQKSHEAIKAIDPNATILMGGIAYDEFTYNGGPFYRYFPDELMLAGGASYFDALNFHYFPDYHDEWERWNPPNPPPTCSIPISSEGFPAYDGSGIDLIAKKNNLTNRMGTCYGANKPIWLTELAQHGYINDPLSLKNQAYYLIKGYSRGLAAGIKNITWFALADANDGYDQGLLYPNTFSPKPAYYAFKTLVRQLNNYKYNRTLNLPGGEAYVFRSSYEGEKIVAWGNNVPMRLSPATALEMTDYLGNVLAIQDGGLGDVDGPGNGSITIILSADPMCCTETFPPTPIPVFIRVTSP